MTGAAITIVSGVVKFEDTGADTALVTELFSPVPLPPVFSMVFISFDGDLPAKCF